MKSQKGITIITLVVIIIIMLLLTGITLNFIINNGISEKTKEAAFSDNISKYNEEFNLYILEKYTENLGSFNKNTINAKNIETETEAIIPIKTIIPSMTDNYFLERIEIVNGKFVFKNFTKEELEIINKIIKVDENEDSNNGGNLPSDNLYKQANVNAPIFPSTNNEYSKVQGEGICAVTYNDRGEPIIQKDLTIPWYNYEEQISNTENGGTSKWANIQTKDGSLWVWIPRFAYKITRGAHVKGWSNGIYTDLNRLDKGKAGTIEIKFLKDNTNEFWDGTGVAESDASKITYTDTPDNVSQNEWLVHPAFNFNEDELNGFWVAKYQASSVEGNGNKKQLDNVLNMKTIQIKPNQYSWRYIDTNYMFGNCVFMGTLHNNYYGFKDNTNTHLMKNIEWGAIAYLAHSSYGRNGTMIQNNSKNYIVGADGPLTTTTGNYYGIYDMVGGASDGVAAVYKSKREQIEFLGENAKVAEYFDIYPIYDSNQKGDAIYETSTKSNSYTSWFGNLSWLVNESETRMRRGGNYTESQSGIFAYHRYSEKDYQLEKVGFRPVIVLEEINNEHIIQKK